MQFFDQDVLAAESYALAALLTQSFSEALKFPVAGSQNAFTALFLDTLLGAVAERADDDADENKEPDSKEVLSQDIALGAIRSTVSKLCSLGDSLTMLKRTQNSNVKQMNDIENLLRNVMERKQFSVFFHREAKEIVKNQAMLDDETARRQTYDTFFEDHLRVPAEIKVDEKTVSKSVRTDHHTAEMELYRKLLYSETHQKGKAKDMAEKHRLTKFSQQNNLFNKIFKESYSEKNVEMDGLRDKMIKREAIKRRGMKIK